MAVNMDGVKFVRAKDKSVIHDFRYSEIESILIDPNDNYMTLELYSTAQSGLAQKTFVFETSYKEDIGHLIASYSPVHASWMKSESEGMKKVSHWIVSCRSVDKLFVVSLNCGHEMKWFIIQ